MIRRLLACLILFTAVPVVAGAVTVTAQFKPTSVKVGDTLEYRITIVADDLSKMPPLQLPNLNYFKIGESKEETAYTLVNGSMRISRTRIISLTATRQGDPTIDPVVVTIAGKQVKSTRSTIHIGSGAVPANRDTGGTRVILRSELSSTHVKVGEPIRYRLRVYRQFMFKEVPTLKEPSFQGFFARPSDANKTPIKSTIQGDVYYGSDAVAYVLYATQPGKHVIAGASLIYTINPPYTDPKTANADDVTVTVDPLPSPAPDHFDGAVGDFLIGAEKTSVTGTQYSPIAVDYWVSGSGNLESVVGVQLPKVDGMTLTKGDVVTVTQSGRSRRKIRVMAIPTRSGLVDIPAVKLVVFSLKSQKYVTIESSVVHVQVKPGVAASEILVKSNRLPVAPIQPFERRASRKMPWRGVILSLLVANMAVFGTVATLHTRRVITHRWGGAIRRRRAVDAARNQLNRMDIATPNAVVDMLRVGRQALGAVVGYSIDGLSRDLIELRLTEAGFSPAFVTHTGQWISEMEALVYRPDGVSHSVSRAMLQTTIEWLEALRPYGEQR